MEGYHPNQSLSEAVDALQNCVSNFLDQLSAERDILLNGNAEQLSVVTDSKNQILNELKLLENQIRPGLSVLTALTNEANQTNNNEADLALQQKWQNVVNMLTECHQINAENGALVNTHLKQTKNALSHLFSLFNISSSVTYNEQGNQQFYTQSNRSIHV